jgi:molecular chaperone HtpG
MSDNASTYVFQAEINQLLSLIINTFYSNKEVFLRELVSNASDACDKIRHIGLTNPDALAKGGADLVIQITPNKEANTLTITDTGVGMTKDDLMKNLGTIAHSGTKQFMEALGNSNGSSTAEAASSLIGQFGMGFYAAFLVADKVEVFSRSYDVDAKVHVWESTANGTFSISEVSTDLPLKRGTQIVLHMKEDQKEYLEESTLRDVLKKHSEFINYPIQLLTKTERDVEVEEKESEGGGNEDGEVQEVTAEKEEAKKKKEIVEEYVIVNELKPIWMRRDATNEEHAAFYKATFNDWDSHSTLNHFTAEGNVSFTGLLYVPKHAPFDMFDPSKKRANVRLYVRRVFITDECEKLVPEWLGFVKGIVDSEDLPLNISREILQKSKIVDVIRKTIVKKSIEMIRKLADDDSQKYIEFYETFGKNIKWGITEDNKNQAKLTELLRFKSNRSVGDDYVTLDDYVSRMKEGQNDIYFITGDNIDVLRASVFVEVLESKGYEVLYMTDPMDEYLMQGLRTYKEKPFKCVTKDGDLFGGEDGNVQNDEELFATIKKVLNGDGGDDGAQRVAEVKGSKRIAKSPCVIVTDTYGWTANMERIMRAQALRANNSLGPSHARKILEVNLQHPVVDKIRTRIRDEGVSQGIKDTIHLLYDVALLNSGFNLDNPSKFADKIHNVIALNMGVDDCSNEVADSPADDNEQQPNNDDTGGLEELD